MHSDGFIGTARFYKMPYSIITLFNMYMTLFSYYSIDFVFTVIDWF